MIRPAVRRHLIIAAGILAAIAAAGYLFATRSSLPVASLPAAAGPGTAATAVHTTYPERKTFAREVEALGTVRANESVDITAKVADRVVAIHFEEGQQVRKGQLLVELESSEPRADLAAAEAAAGDSRSQYRRSQELYATQALSEAQLDQLRAALQANEARAVAARSRLEDRRIIAPFAGRVGLRNVSLGGLVSPGQIITTLDDLSIVKLDFSVPELFMAVLQPGLTIEARSTAYPGEIFTGRVASVATRLDPISRSIGIRALIDNRDDRLRPGMFMNLKLVREEGAALLIPEGAIVPEDSRHFVFVVDEGRVYKRQVEIGRRRPGEVEILQGLTPQDQIVTDGTLNVHDGARVRVEADAGGPDAGTEVLLDALGERPGPGAT
ncbi:hypothetical protein ACG33_12245 [Steroidobacter denitrificans]|uniref:Uncharacterized protein n=2 Tax=Steroidobacter denitrificans TaxID=465721 RepID=A0A127FDU0_STEDE|nr:hypothetical protein ACG33_12245 [Steroidobacter denitrificans]